MSHLLAISVGPVQEFISAARRTRDLWFGSKLLSDISRAVAASVESQGGALIFPANVETENVANIILAELPTADPKTVAKLTKNAAQDFWKAKVDEAWKHASGAIRKDVWDSQVEDVIEYYAAWVAMTEDYCKDRERVNRLLVGRKNCRDFRPAHGADAGLPKSSLDGQRETVLKEKKDWPSRFQQMLRIREGEQLDIVGMVKRLGGGSVSYPSVSRVAADPWVRGQRARLEPVIDECRNLGSILHKVEATQYTDFPFEGTSVYVMRHHELIEEAEVDAARLMPLQDALSKLPEPNPYLAVLVADGDKMGEALRQSKSAGDNRKFSSQLAGFASSAKVIVEDSHGVLIYAGGDDVLAFVPVDQCLACARKLHTAFADQLRDYRTPTLSVGIAIGHFMENLEDLLQYGREAEKHAKRPDRNGLAVHLHKRGGAPIEIRSRWTENPDERLHKYAELLRKESIPGKLPYDLRKLAEVYKAWPGSTLAEALQHDVLRIIRDKQPRGGKDDLPEIEQFVKDQIKDVESLMHFSHELLVARQIAEAMTQAGVKS
jgi:CRISPR-associated protein Cmr2